MIGTDSVVALVLLEWTAGLVAAATWTQSWAVVRRGHFRIVAWTSLALAALAALALAPNVPVHVLVGAFVGVVAAYLAVQYVRARSAGLIFGGIAAALGLATLLTLAGSIASWPWALAVAGFISGAVLLGAVTNGMMLGHWYLNQPGLKPWALGRLTTLSLAAVLASAAAGVAGAGFLMTAATPGAAFALPGVGDSFGGAFFGVWLALLGFTGAVVWMAKRCVEIRSIQSATGLYYVALLTAGTSEFIVRYLMVNAT